jgi:hypothetical protein
MTQTPEPTLPVSQSEPVAPPYSQPLVPAAAGVPAYAGGAVPLGKIRSTGTCVLLSIVTLGIYTWYWYFATHSEMKRHTGNGVGGGLALILAIFFGIVSPFLSSAEVGNLYERRGQAKPVSGATGLWFLLLGWFFLVGAIVWFVKTNGALNAYWRSQGAQG